MVMPYLLEKGEALSYLERFLNGDVAPVVTALDGLRFENANLFGGGGVFPGDPTLEQRIRTNWFGQVPVKDAAGVVTSWQPQPALVADAPASTGYWIGYYGAVEAILRETLIRAVEVSLGVDHLQPVPMAKPKPNSNEPPKPQPRRRWPVELFWKCSNPWYEGWVTWRAQPSGPKVGQVTVVLASPGDNRNRLIHDSTQPPNSWDRSPPPNKMVNPAKSDTEQGMWVVSHRQHLPCVQQRVFTPKADAPVNEVLEQARARYLETYRPRNPPVTWEFPQIGTLWQGNVTPRGEPDIVVVAPPYVDGGVSSSV